MYYYHDAHCFLIIIQLFIIKHLHAQLSSSPWANLPGYFGQISPSALGIHARSIGHRSPWAWARIPIQRGRTPLWMERISSKNEQIRGKPSRLRSNALPPQSQRHDNSSLSEWSIHIVAELLFHISTKLQFFIIISSKISHILCVFTNIHMPLYRFLAILAAIVATQRQQNSIYCHHISA